MIPDLSAASPRASAEQMARSIEQARLLSTLRTLGTVSGAANPSQGREADDAFRLRLIEALGQYAEAARRAAAGAPPAGAGSATTIAPGLAGSSTPAPVATSTPASSPGNPAPSSVPVGTGAASGAAPSTAPPDAETFIRQVADRHGIDRDFLLALRKVENGGPGREFGVLSVPAPTFADQAQVAAETVRRNVQRYEATGRPAIDPATGRYTEGFVRFFSGRYAPIGAANDPGNLNVHHARNLIQRYTDIASRS